jgi:hypothetical protein
MFECQSKAMATTLALDPLHGIHLGIMMRFVVFCLWLIVDADAYGMGCSTDMERMLGNVWHMRAELWTHYQNMRRKVTDAGGRYNVTELGNLTYKMLGDRDALKMKAKAAQTLGLLPFVIMLLRKFSNTLGDVGMNCLAAGEALMRFMDILKESGRVLSNSALQETYKKRCLLFLFLTSVKLFDRHKRI